MFAFAVVEHATGRLVLARDRLGIKPLYLDQTPQRLRFASTLPALLAGGGTDTSIDRDRAGALHDASTAWCRAPRTILNGVRKLPPATVRVVEPDGTATDHVYWAPEFSRDPDRRRLDRRSDWQEALLDALRAAVERRMVADVPVGVLLSGGIDSSLVVALLAEAGQTGLQHLQHRLRLRRRRVRRRVRVLHLVAEHFGTDHHRIRIDSSRLLPGHRRAPSPR